jgi:exodeoxyribonuclease-5
VLQKTEAITKFRNQVKEFLPFTPNSDQQTAISQITEFILATDERSVFLLKGYAGTGKTNLVSAITKALPSVRWRSVLLAPTGRAAKVFSNYSQRPAFTIHKKIFRNNTDSDGRIVFSLAENLHRNTLFIVDEASMISAGSDNEDLFSSVLESLFEYVYSGDNCKLLMVGDTAQLPPVGSDSSPALDPAYLKNSFYLNISGTELKEVARQRSESGILNNATAVRLGMMENPPTFPGLRTAPDVIRLSGADLEDAINRTTREYGEENVIVITRSNKRAGMFNRSYRNMIRYFEEDLCAGDRLMVVKNNYYWLPENNGEAGFIANGDMAEITRITKREQLYGLGFCDCMIRLIDYPNLPEQQVKLITDCLYSDHPALTNDDQKALYQAVLNDMSNEPARSVRMEYVRKSPYYNALQVKFSYAITCHKAQGGQWAAVFVDQGFLKDDTPDLDYQRWIYTAMTRATEKLFLLNFEDRMMAQDLSN